MSAADAYPGVQLEALAGTTGLKTVVDAATSDAAGSVVVEHLGRGWPVPAGGDGDGNVVEWSDGDVVVRTSRQNLTPVYAWTDERHERLLLGTDLAALTARVLGAVTPRSDLLTRIREARARIRMVPAHSTVRFRSRPGTRGLTVEQSTGPAFAAGHAPDETAVEAGRRQLDAMARHLAAPGGGPVTALVSGGVDSGVVAALAHRAGTLDAVATLGTVWGDERAEADELGAHLGLPVRYVPLSEDDIVHALPETVRMLGEPTPETVAITSNLVALFRSGGVPQGVLLTGYGSDLLNSGLRVGAGLVQDVGAAVVQQLEHAGVSGEFSGVAAASHGYVLRHPFWSSDVIQAALDTRPEHVRHGGREKGHLRAAAAELLPEDVAWRPKRALHRGSGVDENLARAVARRVGRPDVDVARFYACVDAQLVDGMLRSPTGSVDAPTCVDAAAHLYETSA